MPERAHPALGVEITIASARRLFPGTPAGVFWWACHATSAGERLTFFEAYRVAAEHWQSRAKAAQSARRSVAIFRHRKTRKKAAEEAGYAGLRAVIDFELATLMDFS